MIVHLHAGTHKTGTTAIQSFLFANRDALDGLGLYVPRAGLVGTAPEMAHHNLAWELAGMDVDDGAGDLAALVRELRERRPERVCLTSENFSSLYAVPGALERLRAAVEEAGGAVRPILFFRPQASYLEALYAELVKHGLTEPFDAFFDGALADGAVRFNDLAFGLEYDRVASAFAEAFGPETVTVFPYLGATSAGAILSTLLPALGPWPPDVSFDALAPPEVVNLTIGLRGVAQHLESNRADEGSGFEDVIAELDRDGVRDPAAFFKPLGPYWRGKFQPLGVEELARLLARFGDGNRILLARFGAEVPVCPTDRLFDEARSGRSL